MTDSVSAAADHADNPADAAVDRADGQAQQVPRKTPPPHPGEAPVGLTIAASQPGRDRPEPHQPSEPEQAPEAPAPPAAMPPDWDDEPRWFEEMPAVSEEPDLDRFLPPRSSQPPADTTYPPDTTYPADGTHPADTYPSHPAGHGTHANSDSGYVDYSDDHIDAAETTSPNPVVTTDTGSGQSWEKPGINADDLLAGTALQADASLNDTLELRQIAGLTAGTVIPLDRPSYAFAEGDGEVGFRIEVHGTGRVEVIPEAATVAVDSVPVTEATSIGLGVLDVGSARFIVRSRLRHARDWPDDRQTGEIESPLIHVPADLASAPSRQTPTKRRRRLFSDERPGETLDAASWEFVETVRETRGEEAERKRFLHPDPTDLAARARHGASPLGMRRPGDHRFGRVGVLCADLNWMPRFDDIQAVPESLGDYLRPLMSLPSVPIVADLLVGPLGITGPRGAAAACARHIMLSLYGLSSPDLTLHVVADPEHESDWTWASSIAPHRPIDPRSGYPVLLVDGTHNFPGTTGIDHQLVMASRAGLIVLADHVEQLPSYCGTVLQVDRSSSGLLTNHQGKVINGTPIGVTTALARELADDLTRYLGLRR